MKLDKIFPNIATQDRLLHIEYNINDLNAIISSDANKDQLLTKLAVNEEDFLFWAVGIFSKIEPIFATHNTINVTKTIHPDNFRDVLYKDVKYSAEDVIILFRFFREMNWSDFTTISQTSSKVFNSAVPLFLYAQKLYNNIPYNHFRNATQSQFATLLGKGFRDFPLQVGTYDVNHLRYEMVTGKRGGSVHLYPFTAYKYNKTSDEVFNELPKMLRMLLAQVWIFNGQCRNDNMILDWNDWSRVPDTIDTVPMTLAKKYGGDDVAF